MYAGKICITTYDLNSIYPAVLILHFTNLVEKKNGPSNNFIKNNLPYAIIIQFAI